MKTCILIDDIFSNNTDKRGKPIQYGERNEKVKVISRSGDVIIVEGRYGRFPVRIEKVKY